jgi:transcriptional regulator GlxA family with amidase domain
MRVSVLALDDAFDTGLSSILDTFEYASALAEDGGRHGARIEARLVGVRRRVTTHRGMRVDVEPIAAPADVVVVPALFARSSERLLGALERRDVHDACAALVEHAGRGAVVAAACTGTFVLAASRLLDGRAATTAWWLAPAFRARFPEVELDESRMVVNARGRVTAGAALAHVDLALWLVRRRSPALAAQAARFLVVDARPSQAPFMIPDQLAHADPLVERFERWIRTNLARPFSVAAAARAVGASERSLERRVRAVLGKSPILFVQDVRVEVASHLLKTTDNALDAVAAAVGYKDGVTLRTLLRRKLGKTVRELRKP